MNKKIKISVDFFYFSVENAEEDRWDIEHYFEQKIGPILYSEISNEKGLISVLVETVYESIEKFNFDYPELAKNVDEIVGQTGSFGCRISYSPL